MTKEVRPANNWRMPAWTSRSVWVSILDVASSSIKMRGLDSMALAKATSWPLPHGEAAAPLLNVRVVPFFHLHDKLVGVDGFGRFYDLLIRGVQPAIPDIILYGARKEKGV